MKISYSCEVCGYTSQNREEVERCERRPPPTQYPRGLIFGSTTGFYKDITFVIAENNVANHYNSASLWAFRDNVAGDSRDVDDLCGSPNATVLSAADKANPDHPTFKRAVEFLRRHGVPASVWDGKQAVALQAFEAGRTTDTSCRKCSCGKK